MTFSAPPLLLVLALLANLISTLPAPAWAQTRGTATPTAVVSPSSEPSPVAVSGTEAISEQDETTAEDRVLSALNDVVSWHRSITALDGPLTNVREVALQSTVQQNANATIRFAFDYAKAQAAVLAAQPVSSTDESVTARQQVAAELVSVTARLGQLQQQQAQVAAALRRAPARLREGLQAQQDAITGQIEIGQAQQQLLQNVTGLFSAQTVTAGNSLEQQINELQQSIPEFKTGAIGTSSTVPLSQGGSATSRAALALAQQAVAQTKATNVAPAPSGLIGMIRQAYQLSRKVQTVGGLEDQAESLRDQGREQIASLRAQLQTAVAQGNALALQQATAPVRAPTSGAASGTAPQAATQVKAEFDRLVAQYQAVSQNLPLLAQEMIWLDATRRSLNDWQQVLGDEMRQTLQDFSLQLLLLALGILVPIILSIVAKRAIDRYVQDAKRRRQFKAVRRIVLGVAIFLIVLLNFVSEFSAFATFLGFATAGITLSLQNVILSLVAHFLFFGRFSVRVGDRVTVGDITGDIVELGPLRMYIMQVIGQGQAEHPTGRVVAFPNSIMFQAAAFTKHIRGSNYIWRELTVELAPGSDYAKAQERLLGAVCEIFETYKEELERRRHRLEQSTRLLVRAPKPEGTLRFAANSLAYVIRYPAEPKRATEMDDAVTRRVMEELHKEPKLDIVWANPPKITSAEDV